MKFTAGKLIIVIFLVITIIIALVFFNKQRVSGYENDNLNYEQFILEKTNKMKELLINHKITGIDKIIGRNIRKDFRTIFLYSGNDCGKCISKGFQIIKYIDSLYNDPPLYVISSNSNISADMINYDYSNFIYLDKNGLIRTELKFLYTPVFLVINREDIIKDIHFILPLKDSEKEITDIKYSLISLIKNQTF